MFFTLLRNGTTYAAIARTQNQLAVGTYLDRVSPTATGDLSTVLNGINVISDDEARTAFDQLGGPIHPTLAQIGVQNTSMVIYQVTKRLRSGPFTPGGGMSVADNDRRGGGAPIARWIATPMANPASKAARTIPSAMPAAGCWVTARAALPDRTATHRE